MTHGAPAYLKRVFCRDLRQKGQTISGGFEPRVFRIEIKIVIANFHAQICISNLLLLQPFFPIPLSTFCTVKLHTYSDPVLITCMNILYIVRISIRGKGKCCEAPHYTYMYSIVNEKSQEAQTTLPFPLR